MVDPISDLVVRIKNANKAKLPSIAFVGSNLTIAILEVLKAEGYITNFKVLKKGSHRNVIVELKYKKLIPTINGIKQISKPSLRVYMEADKLPHVLHGLGIAIVSTSKGIMTDSSARKANLGGEVLLYVW